ncbi:MAG: UvrD-helicase domain-containing protein [Myxococcota bacterium]
MSRKRKGADENQLGFSFDAPPPTVLTDGSPPPVTSSAPGPSLLPPEFSEEPAAADASNVLELPLPARRPPKSAPRRDPLPPPPGIVELSEGLRLERNLAVLAGAGAGKTYSLVTMCLHLLSGARAGREAIDCAGLGLLTFTDKAAGEMRGRLRARLDELAEGRGEERELRAAFEALGRPFPRDGAWRRIRDELGAATISTFHALCIQILRRAPAASGVNPDVELLEERSARELLERVVERVVLEQVQAGNESLRQLVRDLGFGGRGQWGLVDALVPVVSRLREEGLSPDYLPVANAEQLRARFEESLAALRKATLLAYQVVGRNRAALDDFSRILERASFERWPEDGPRLWLAIRGQRSEAFAELKDFVCRETKKLDRRAQGRHLGLLHGACQMAPHEAALRQVLSDLMARHRDELARRGAVDFTGLLVQARDLLRDFPEARREAQGRFQALLVDEFQDTNRLQLELVLMLSERRDGAARPLSRVLEGRHPEIERELPLEPAFLAVVGDRKQAIYEFRGADVSVFEVMAQAIERSGGGRVFLQDSRRSSPQLVAVLNALMPRVLGREKYGEPVEDFEIVYEPATDDLRAVRPPSVDEHPLVAVSAAALPGPGAGDEQPDAQAQREADAEAVARAVAELVHRREYRVAQRGSDELRAIRGGDVALLFQRFTQVELYRQALVRHGVRHRVIRGRGFYGAQEVVDVACLLSILVDPSDALSLAAVLRGPLVGVTDTSLLRFALPTEPGGALGLAPERLLLASRIPPGLSDAERARLQRFLGIYATLRAERDRLGLRALLRVAFEAFSLRAVLAAGPYGEQAVANLDKLLELATQREARGVGVAAFARELSALADAEPTEAQGEVVDEHDLDAVTLCTVHQAKGLEWPVVVLPDLATVPPNQQRAVRFDRALGLALKPPASDDGEQQSLNAQEIDERTRRRVRAESLRLLYVALTRARDRVVLGLLPEKPRSGSWAWELGLHQWKNVVPHQLPAGGEARRPPSDPLLPAQDARAHVQAVLDRVRFSAPAVAATAVLPVTQLQDFVTCPRLFHFSHQLSLAPSGEGRSGGRADGGEDVEVEADVRTLGTAAHKLLELTSLREVGTPRLSAHLKELQATEGLSALGEAVPAWVERFWGTPFGRRVAALGDERVHRELPFLLSLQDGAFRLALKGQIDLLVEEDGEVLVIDYKTSVPSPAGLAPYRFQLGCYALAARRFIARDVPIRAGIVFLRHEDRTPVFLEQPIDAGELERTLTAEARALTRAQGAFEWSGRPRPTCEALGCGYVYRCHP